MLRFSRLNEFAKTLITAKNNTIICSERKVVDNLGTICITIFTSVKTCVICSNIPSK